MQLANMLLLADIEDIIRALIPIMFVIFWVASQIWSAIKEKPGKVKAPQRPNPVRPIQAQPRKPNDISGEIEEFLRRAAADKTGGDERQAEQQRAARRPPKEQRKRREPQPVVEVKREESRRLTKARPLAQSQPAATPRLEPTMTSRAEQPTAVAHADEAMQQHLAQVFGHTVGTLGTESPPPQASDPTPPKPAPVEAPIGLAALLANPKNMQTAIVLNEILQRPEERW